MSPPPPAPMDPLNAGPGSLLKPLLGVALIVGGAVAVRSFWGDQLEPRKAVDALASVQGRWWSIPLFLGVYVVGTATFVPALLFHMASGATFGAMQGTLLNIVAVNLSGTVHFFAARWLGGERVAGVLRRYSLKGFQNVGARHGARMVAAVRQLPFPHLAVNVAAGISTLRWRDFALGTLIGTVPSVAIYAYFGASLVAGVEGAKERAMTQVVGAAALVIALSFAPRLWRWLRARNRPT